MSNNTISPAIHISELLTGDKPVARKIEFLKNNTLESLDNSNLAILYENTKESIVKRELVSKIGKIKDKKFTTFLTFLLEDNDPKIVIQAIRGLHALKDDNISQQLKKYRDHPNELVQNYVNNIFFKQQSNKPNMQVNDRLKNMVVNGDTLQIMQEVPDNSIHLTFTSPPYYNARDYSIYQSYEEYLKFLSEVFKAIHRITVDGRFFVINTSPIIIPRASRQNSSKRYPIPFDIHRFIMDAGFEFIDDILWVKPEASVKNRNGGFMQHRKPLGYKPNIVTEYVMVYRKKTDKLIDWNMRQYADEVIENSKIKGDYETTNVWRIDPASDKIHSAIFPEELTRRVIQFYSYKGDLVFDPFAGSGTVGKVALDNERFFFLTELNQEYFSRIKSKVSGLFNPKLRFLSMEEFEQLWQ